MGKRKSEENPRRSKLMKKLKKLEKRIKYLGSDSSDEDIVITSKSNSPDLHGNSENIPPELVNDVQPDNEVENTELLDEMIEDEVPQEVTLDDQVLEILGVEPNPEKAGEDLHKEIAQRWDVILKKGLAKEEKDRIEKENPPFTNMKLMLPPKLNPEVSAAVNEMSRKRDQLILKRQQQVATALSCLGSGLQMCLKDIQTQKMDIIKKLNDASRLLCDSLCLDTRGRRSLLLSVINKDMKEFLLQSESETYLFGENLTDKIRTAKSVQKSGQELKVAETKKFTPRHNTFMFRQNASKNKALNWRGPPRSEVKKRGGPSSRAPAVERKWEDKRNHQRRK